MKQCWRCISTAVYLPYRIPNIKILNDWGGLNYGGFIFGNHKESGEVCV